MKPAQPRKSADLLTQGQKVADRLHEFLAIRDQSEKKCEYNGTRYPLVEDWQFVAAYFQHTAAVRQVRPLRDEATNEVLGYVAMADVLRFDGVAVSSAETACLRAEPQWASKPDHQLRSMAQTRACAKALRNVFAWVMAIAGLAGTPAEEMDFELAYDICRDCGADIYSEQYAKESRAEFGKVLCGKCKETNPTKLQRDLERSVELARQKANGKVDAASSDPLLRPDTVPVG